MRYQKPQKDEFWASGFAREEGAMMNDAPAAGYIDIDHFLA